ncbi:hypothetical protein QSJ18_17205 [Gordonia sp. ABSL1-1]|uniref:hypothetical protein n=1 Tax=Gordonia sp. ABSL1-1 TaxID=3053923 RepID=UPI002572BEC0|nr:hypothetical protein [Gordonia sp. ABSL1-1]MDL9938489.1 hypothetical protein [Gordonia sp. ABSL1-1]
MTCPGHSLTRGWAVLAGVLSAGVSVGAHQIAGGGSPTAEQWTLLAALGAGVGALWRPGQGSARPSGRARQPGTSLWTILLAAQVLGHLTLSMGSATHHHAMVPSPAMLGWHLIAIPLSLWMLLGGVRIAQIVSSTITTICMASPPPIDRPDSRVVAGRRPECVSALCISSVGTRAPPSVRAFGYS